MSKIFKGSQILQSFQSNPNIDPNAYYIDGRNLERAEQNQLLTVEDVSVGKRIDQVVRSSPADGGTQFAELTRVTSQEPESTFFLPIERQNNFPKLWQALKIQNPNLQVLTPATKNLESQVKLQSSQKPTEAALTFEQIRKEYFRFTELVEKLLKVSARIQQGKAQSASFDEDNNPQTISLADIELATSEQFRGGFSDQELNLVEKYIRPLLEKFPSDMQAKLILPMPESSLQSRQTILTQNGVNVHFDIDTEITETVELFDEKPQQHHFIVKRKSVYKIEVPPDHELDVYQVNVNPSGTKQDEWTLLEGEERRFEAGVYLLELRDVQKNLVDTIKIQLPEIATIQTKDLMPYQTVTTFETENGTALIPKYVDTRPVPGRDEQRYRRIRRRYLPESQVAHKAGPIVHGTAKLKLPNGVYTVPGFDTLKLHVYGEQTFSLYDTATQAEVFAHYKHTDWVWVEPFHGAEATIYGDGRFYLRPPRQSRKVKISENERDRIIQNNP